MLKFGTSDAFISVCFSHLLTVKHLLLTTWCCCHAIQLFAALLSVIRSGHGCAVFNVQVVTNSCLVLTANRISNIVRMQCAPLSVQQL